MKPIYRLDFNPNVSFDEHAWTRVTTMGNIIKLSVLDKEPCKPPIRKLSKDFYLDLRTGEVKEYQHNDSRADSLQGIRRSLEKIRALVNTNVTVPENTLWATLTYAENMTDPKRLYDDFKNFIKRLNYWCKQNSISVPEYISVVEPQGRGAWHCHVFFIWNQKAPYVDNNSVLQVLWGHGFTKIKAIKNVDNIGAYFSAYLADIPLDELPDSDSLGLDPERILVKEFEDSQGHIKEKKFVKGGRMRLYPAGMNLYRCSRGIKKPVVEDMTYKNAQKKVSSLKPTFSRVVSVLDDDRCCVVNTSLTAYYNRNR